MSTPTATRVPYQCLISSEGILIAARGSSIDLFNLESHTLLSTWKSVSRKSEQSSMDTANDSTSHPPKRRKLSNAGENSQIRGENKKVNKRSDALVNGLQAPAVTALAVTKKAGHVIAVTAEDKSIRVFEIVPESDGNHRLQQISQRIMPKRPCAIAVTDDDCTIIAADKFGDVYSLPILVSDSDNQGIAETFAQKSNSSTSKSFVPAANDLTVHSQRNLKALENQKRQTNKPSEKSEPSFEHKLLLGHVSMLTDLALVTLERQQYIITADRDEHIRISRGIPQTHIIEGYCLGHTEFVSRLCVPYERPNILISGGGDDDLLVWNWPSGLLVSKLDIKSHVKGVMSKLDKKMETADLVKVAIAGIYHIRSTGEDGIQDLVTVSCEGVPALFTFSLTALDSLEHVQTIELPGNPLSVTAPSTTNGTLLVSIDCVHQLGSTTEHRDYSDTTSPIVSFVFQNHRIAPTSEFGVVDDADLDGSNALERLTKLLYNLENLRKRDGDGGEEV